jgi:uncharacterized protein (TIGR03067 family)
MRKTMLVAGAMLVLALQLPAEDKKDAANKLVGTWTVTAEEKDGKQQTAEGIKDKTVKISRDTITCSKDSKPDMVCTYRADSSTTPMTITMTCTEGEHKGKTLKGIAELQDDTLRICYSHPDQDAPKDFKTKENQCCFTLKRGSK